VTDIGNPSAPASVTPRSPFHGASHDPTESLSGDARLFLRLWVAITRWRLDHQIADGRPCDCTPAHTLRARQLTQRDTRRKLAGELRSVARSRPALSTTATNRTQLNTGQEALVRLADELEGPCPVSARGVALAQALLTDGVGSPLFSVWCEPAAVHAVRKVGALLVADPR
jgi:hypothetical protein